VQLLFLNVPLLCALGLAAVGVGIARRRARVLLAVAGIGAVAALSLLPWAGPVLATRSWSVLLQVPLGPREILGEMARAASAPVGALTWVWLVLIGLALTPAAQRPSPPGPSPASGRGEKDQDVERQADVRLFSLLALPLAILAQGGFLQMLGYAPRAWYFLPLLALAGIALDVRLAGSPLGRTVRLGAALLVALVLAMPAWSLAKIRMTNVDLVAERIAAQAAPEDLVVVAPWYYGISYQRYGRGTTPMMTVPDLADHGIHRYDLVKARMAQAEPLGGVLAAIERTLRSGHRVWVAGDLRVPPPGTPVPVLPPAPHAATGWREAPYLLSWSHQLGAYLRDHAVVGDEVPVAWKGPVNGFERLQLVVLSGWRE